MSPKQPLLALTIHAHWVWAIFEGLKRFENRSWTTHYRGPLIVHAGTNRKALNALRRGEFDGYPWPADVAVPADDQLVFRAVVGVVDLVDVQQIDDLEPSDPWAVGPFCWTFANPRALSKPIRCDGRLGLWTPPAAAIAAVRRERLAV